MKGFLPSLLIALMLLCPAASHGTMIVRDFTPARHYRFYNGSDKNFVGNPYDFSGVGCGSSGRWVTLMTDNCFLSAYHLHPGTGETVTFWATNDLAGPSYTYTVMGGVRIGTTDIWVGWFDAAVDTSIARYPIAVLPTAKEYRKLVLYNYGINHRIGRNVLDKIALFQLGGSTGLSAFYDYDNNDVPSSGGDETYLQVGDSGAPSFAVFNSRIALIGTHWANTSHAPAEGAISIDTFAPAYFNEINKVLKERGQSLNRYWWRSRKKIRAHSGT